MFLRDGNISLSDNRLWRPEAEGPDGKIVNGRDKVSDPRTYRQGSLGTRATFRHTPRTTSSFGKPYFTGETTMWFYTVATGSLGMEDSFTRWSAPYDLSARLEGNPIDFEYTGEQDQLTTY